MRKIICFLLCFVMVCMCLPKMPSSVAARTYTLEQALAEDLKTLGIFKGVSETDFALDRAPTRTEALVMLIRLLGEEEKALSEEFSHPFSDVFEWAEKYVAYAYEKGYTNGISETEFGSGASATKEMYLTFVLRALGYTDGENGDFTWNSPYKLSEDVGLLKYENEEAGQFLRADVVLISHCALSAKVFGAANDLTLAEKLVADGAFGQDAYDALFGTSKTPEKSEKEDADKFSFIKAEGELDTYGLDLSTGTKSQKAMRVLNRFIQQNADFFEPPYEYFVYRNDDDRGEAHYMLISDREKGDVHVAFKLLPKEGGAYFVRLVLESDGETFASVDYYASRRSETPVKGASAYFDRDDIYYGMSVDFENFSGRHDEKGDFEKISCELILEAVELLDNVMSKNFAYIGYASVSALGFDL